MAKIKGYIYGVFGMRPTFDVDLNDSSIPHESIYVNAAETKRHILELFEEIDTLNSRIKRAQVALQKHTVGLIGVK